MDRYLHERIECITEADFWSAMKRVKGLEPALAAGLAGRRAEAYRLLGAYHEASLAPVRDVLGEEPLGGATPPAADKLAALRAQADPVLRHDITGWHTHRRQFGPVIDFDADFGRSGQYGFHYLGWLAPVLRVYAQTGEMPYRDAFLTIIKQYYEQRTKLHWRIPGLHPVYYELGSRAKTNLLLPAYALLVGEEAFDPDAREAVLKLLLGFARSLCRLQKGGYRAGNWQIVGAASLYALGAAFPEFREAATWRRLGAARIEEHRRRDFFSDGGHGERCWGYGYMSLSGMIGYYQLAVRRGFLTGAAKGQWTKFLKRAFQWYARTTAPGAMMLNYGDGNIGSAAHIIERGYRLFPELRKQPGMLGIDRAQSCLLPASGYAFMRAESGDGDAPYMSINFGRWGGGHTHADLLSLTVWRYGEPIIEEVGRFNSYDNPLDALFRSPEAHNQIILEHHGMDRRNHEAQDVRWFSSPTVDCFTGWHGAYGAARIRRQIVFVKPDYWLVCDVVTATEYIFQATAKWHAPRPFERLGEGRLRVAGSPSCLLLLGRPGDCRRIVTGVDYDRRDWTGDDIPYLVERHHAGVMKWRDIGDPRPLVFATLLAPFRDEAMPALTITEVPTAGDDSGEAAAFAVDLGHRQDLLVFNPTAAPLTCDRTTVTAPLAVRRGHDWQEIALT